MLTIKNLLGIEFAILLIRKGESYGRGRRLTHRSDDPLVQFFCASESDPETKAGRFISEYGLSTLVKGDEATGFAGGLDLAGQGPAYELSEADMRGVMKWLRTQT